LNLSKRAFQQDIPEEAKVAHERFVRGMVNSIYQGRGFFITVKAHPVLLRILTSTSLEQPEHVAPATSVMIQGRYNHSKLSNNKV
jgi:hypothetical protein